MQIQQKDRNVCMKTLLYNENSIEVEQELVPLIEDNLPSVNLQTVKSLDDLRKELSFPLHGVGILLLCVESGHHLMQLTEMSSLFEGIRLILVLPSREKTMAALAVTIKTSYISYIDSSFTDVVSVMDKIIE